MYLLGTDSDHVGVCPAIHISTESSNPITTLASINSVDMQYDITPYDGSEKRPNVSIRGLTEGSDYTVDYKNNIDVGTASVVITGQGDYSGKITKTFEIIGDDKEGLISLSNDSFTYDGTEKKPIVSIENLSEGEDFDVEYSNNVNVGTARATAVMKGSNSGAITKTFRILPKDIAETESITLKNDKLSYDGKAKEPPITVGNLRVMFSSSISFSIKTLFNSLYKSLNLVLTIVTISPLSLSSNFKLSVSSKSS